ncbi:WD-40 repeat-containing protein [Colletotrichum karsti]|uniref:methylated diphthine methylhydrolase n=1 Tax=Colletotrichum karsti TaxID=1095194 RepID=A0A9P6I0K6_9PEZI|nr:WD-40 repeat-containing protein [Colletotrichum karsti]KAF9873605.1 WD-40 repeat-containing protein [Colletotrichum karsti]
MGGPDNTITSRQSLTLDLPPSCIEFCLSHPAYFVVGTYNLVKDEPRDTESEDTNVSTTKKPQNRNGSLIVFQLEKGAIRHVQTISHPSAILDLHFCPVSSRQDVLAVVSSTGTLSVFKLDPTTDSEKPLKHLATSRIPETPEGALFLSGVWSPSDPASLAITTSTGEVRVVQLDESWKIVDDGAEAIITHSLEAWTVAFSPHEEDKGQADSTSSFVVYSGGDDSALRYASCTKDKAGNHETISTVTTQYPPLNIRDHGAGVTAILPVPIRLADGSMIVVTGSYDDTIRVLSVQHPHETYGIRKFKRLADENLGGGVWRLKLIDLQEEDGQCRLRVLASCMHAGARVVELKGPIEGGEWEINVLGRFEEHQSMNYGSDLVPGPAEGHLVCVSTSFYDQLLCLWETPLS